LRMRIEEARQARGAIEVLVRRSNAPTLIEQAAIAGLLDPAHFAEDSTAQAAADQLAERLNRLEGALEANWGGELVRDPEDQAHDALVISRVLRRVREAFRLELPLLMTGEAQKLTKMKEALTDLYDHPATLKIKDQNIPVAGPMGLLQAVMEAGRKGVSVQRYKGLGEMNPDQLWETTLDPEARSLLQVKVSHVDDAEEIFSTLMGDVVEPRREFIQSHALEVENLDI